MLFSPSNLVAEVLGKASVVDRFVVDVTKIDLKHAWKALQGLGTCFVGVRKHILVKILFSESLFITKHDQLTVVVRIVICSN